MSIPVARWHRRAQLARSLAQSTESPAGRAFMLRYATECERIADQCLLGFPPRDDILPDLSEVCLRAI